LTIEWDVLIVEMSLLAGIIWGAVYLEHWAYMYSQKKEEEKTRKNIIKFIENDLEQRLNFIDDSLRYKDYKPFFTDMWDAVILAGKHALLSFELFQSLQRSYSWMKYYNSELEGIKRDHFDEKVLKELLDDVRQSIEKSAKKIRETRGSEAFHN
jgi:hypothetical protein